MQSIFQIHQDLVKHLMTDTSDCRPYHLLKMDFLGTGVRYTFFLLNNHRIMSSGVKRGDIAGQPVTPALLLLEFGNMSWRRQPTAHVM